MNKRRLLKLAELLEKDARNKKGIKFNMAHWGYVDDIDNLLSCGTSCCAMGLAALSGTFKRAGLTASVDGCCVKIKWKNRIVDGFLAAQRLFDITNGQSDILFAPGILDLNVGAKGERAKVKQIRKFVKTGVLKRL